MNDTKEIESGWLIEFGIASAPSYIAVVNNDMGITVNAFNALRFARKIDAENTVIALGFKGVRCTYHEFGD